MILHIEPGSTPIRGSVEMSGARTATPFSGWIELTGLIEQAWLAGGQDPPDPTTEHQT